MSSLSAATCCACFLRRRPLYAPPLHKLQNDAFWRHQKKNEKQFSLCWSLPFDLSPPPIDLDPLETMTVSEDGTTDTDANDEEALDAFENGAAVCGQLDLIACDVLVFFITEETAVVFFKSPSSLFLLELVYVDILDACLNCTRSWNWYPLKLLSVKRELVMDLSDYGRIRGISLAFSTFVPLYLKLRYIFFADKVEIQDITNQTSMFALLGPKSSEIMKDLNLGDLVGQPYGSHKHYSVGGMPLTVAVGSIISVEGFTFMMSPAAAGSVRKALLGQGAIPMGPSAWETLRIIRGRPAPGKELTEEFNVLEAGLWRAVSLNKGCYKGQETISRLVTYDGIKQRLWGIHLSSPVEPSSIITVDGKKVGKLTSFTAGTKTSGPFGLGYIKKKGSSEGDSVIVGDSIVGTLVEVPFLRDQLPPSKA
ncbi:hypothetical protein DH2020_029741 [Rehmannia glutinosa]|uniref:GCVT N-terminal domain-containing protein n=1 Tax=Rehmannia glutinosa TaxID=99300 RepID=A0ABR0VMM3_REHGL